jgi:uncharacterized protein (DUF305 family)
MFSNRSTLRRVFLAVTAGAGALVLLTACGGSNDPMAGHQGMTDSAPAATAAATQPAAGFNDADVMFAQMMIPHHQQAVMMADRAATRAADTEVKNLAAKIKAAQDPEIATMRGWLTTWSKPAPSADTMGHAMPGIMSDDDMHKLEGAKGGEFDKMFVQMMTAHHNGAIEMAKTEQAQGSNPDAKKLAQTIQAAQEAEVTQMQKILDRL